MDKNGYTHLLWLFLGHTHDKVGRKKIAHPHTIEVYMYMCFHEAGV